MQVYTRSLCGAARHTVFIENPAGLLSMGAIMPKPEIYAAFTSLLEKPTMNYTHVNICLPGGSGVPIGKSVAEVVKHILHTVFGHTHLSVPTCMSACWNYDEAEFQRRLGVSRCHHLHVMTTHSYSQTSNMLILFVDKSMMPPLGDE